MIHQRLQLVNNNPQIVYADLEIAGSHSADKATTQTVGHEM